MDGEGEKGTQTANVLLASLRVHSAFLETQSPVMASFEVEREELASAQAQLREAQQQLAASSSCTAAAALHRTHPRPAPRLATPARGLGRS